MSNSVKRGWIIGLTSACGLAASAVAAPQITYCAYPGQTIGGFIPGGTDELITLTGVDNPWIGDDGLILVRTTINGTNVTTANDTILLKWSPLTPSALTQVVREGQLVPGFTDVFYGTVGSNFRMTPNGTTYFGGPLTGAGVVTTGTAATNAHHSLFSPSGTPSLLARRGSTAGTNLPAGVNYNFSAGFSAQAGCVIDSGVAFFQTALREGGTVTANDTAWMYGTVGNLRSILRKGDTLGAGPVGFTGFNQALNVSGQAMFDARYTAGGSISTTNDAFLCLFTPGATDTYTIFAREGDSFSFAGGATTSGSPSPASNGFNNSGQVLYITSLVAGTGTPAVVAGTGGNDSVRVLWTPGPGGTGPGTYSEIIRKGDPAPGIAGATISVLGSSQAALDDAGGVVYSAFLTGTGITAGVNDNAVYYSPTPGVHKLVWRNGNPVPLNPGAVFGGSTSSHTYQVNNRGQVIFVTELAQDPNGPPGSVTPAVNDKALVAWSASTGIRVLARAGGSTTLPDSSTRTFSSTLVSGNQINGGGSRTPCLTNDGKLAIRTFFTDGSFAIATMTVPACVADTDNGSSSGTPDGGVGIEDLLFYLAAFEAGTPNADVDDGSGTGFQDGGVGIEDLLYFLSRFEAGC